MTLKIPVPAQFSDIGRKFHADGQVRTFPGNTIVCHVGAQAALQTALDRLYQRLRTCSAAHAFTLLPPSSWHMTVFEGVCDEVREREQWPAALPLDASLQETHQWMRQQLETFTFAQPMTFALKVSGFWPLPRYIVVDLEPATADDEAALRYLRDTLANFWQMRRATHDSYRFHLSLAYFTGAPNLNETAELQHILSQETDTMAGQLPPFRLGPPEFCRFNDMFAFGREFYLAQR